MKVLREEDLLSPVEPVSRSAHDLVWGMGKQRPKEAGPGLGPLLDEWFSDRGDLAPQGHLAASGAISGGHNGGRGCYRLERVEAGAATPRPVWHRTAPQQTGPGQNVVMRLSDPQGRGSCPYQGKAVNWLEDGAGSGSSEREGGTEPQHPGCHHQREGGEGGGPKRRKEEWGEGEGWRLTRLSLPFLLCFRFTSPSSSQCYCHYCNPEVDTRYVPSGEGVLSSAGRRAWSPWPSI